MQLNCPVCLHGRRRLGWRHSRAGRLGESYFVPLGKLTTAMRCDPEFVLVLAVTRCTYATSLANFEVQWMVAFSYFNPGNEDGTVTRPRAGRSGVGIPVGGRTFLCFPKSSFRLWSPLSLLFSVCLRFLSTCKAAAAYKVNYSTPSNVS